MVSLIDTSKSTELVNGVATTKDVMSFVGLSTDTKPTVTYNDAAIANGSTFLAMDTSAVYMYDADGNTWHAL